ncbi:NAD(P)H-binding protein [Dermatophilus congolensis]|uniref:Putative NADH-flavin reductase n=1 Tax=Dermatophilus congolensis TaxID=1863 RepID=A0A239VG51_9MICO|nr:NAD(P)H-binding protein [Dermatophilus congolensis]MBO3128827.1 NAD(P)H-binding protein [Dermatophilus congolensis]MBO3132535.1 NAD(P)H-binding protein [Dermatophilus congolensis]MBO3133304.1 NAD(P)H-binding protein [Dermatophilus congolensis]MBO3135539.1 NAD(P)H-binding protein [Dermatophilus congolensis]MBO3137778.1 NAD(P)H-binding protein [Dermatophilus congolensis]
MTNTTQPLHVLVTGASGYIGGELVPKLLAHKHHVHVLTRNASSLDDRPWKNDITIIEGDAANPHDLDRALTDTDVAYYLLHSMNSSKDFRSQEVKMATTFADAAERAHLKRIVYLGGIHPDHERLSEHMASRAEVGQIFLDSPIPAACLQAAVVLGAGSVSYQMLKHLTERLPLMLVPNWLRNQVQPIAIKDALHYLAGAATLPSDVNRTFDIACDEILTYENMMKRYAAVAGLTPRIMLPIPLLTPDIASWWVGLVTPIDAGIARPLMGSLVHDVIAKENDIRDYLGTPPGGVTSYDDAIRAAMSDQKKH